MKKILVRIKGGLGNQLFCYAAARRLALANNADLVIDDITGFCRDNQYNRKYMLDKFQIPARKATPIERLEPFERYQRGIMKWLSNKKPFNERRYIEQEGEDFDERLLDLKVKGTLYLDGYWQSEDYFKDVEKAIREDLQIISPMDIMNINMAEKINNSCAVALHVRWFENPNNLNIIYNLSTNYYLHAINFIEQKIKAPHYFLFSNDPEVAINKLGLKGKFVTVISHNRGDENAYADLWLMAKCKYFITANSTFSWWGAWLANEKKKIIIAPNLFTKGTTAWGFKGLIPNDWMVL